MEKVIHEFMPIYDKYSKILILGSIPSKKSREVGFYYGHPKNRFWKVVSSVFNEEMPKSIRDKQLFLKKHHIALWDVLASCEIEGSKDMSIHNPIPNDISVMIEHSQIQKIYTTGMKAYQLYQKYCFPITKIEAIYLPSTSPANAVKSVEQLIKEYSVILEI